LKDLIDYKKLFNLISNLESAIVAREIIQAASGLKSTRLILSESNILKIVQLLKKFKISYFVLDTPVYCLLEGNEFKWSNRILLKEELDKFPIVNIEKNYCIYLDARKRFELLKNSDFGVDDSLIAHYLGIPECCSQFYSKYLKEASLYNLDFIPFCFNETNYKHDGWCNVLSQFLGYCLFSHFPCSLECENTKNISQNALSFIKHLKIDHYSAFLSCHFKSYIYGVHDKILTPISIMKKEGINWYCKEDDKFYSSFTTSRKAKTFLNIKYLRRSICSIQHETKLKKEQNELYYIFEPGMDI